MINTATKTSERFFFAVTGTLHENGVVVEWSTSPPEMGPIGELRGFIKWDGCIDFGSTDGGGGVHVCDPGELVDLMRMLHEIAGELIGERYEGSLD